MPSRDVGVWVCDGAKGEVAEETGVPLAGLQANAPANDKAEILLSLNTCRREKQRSTGEREKENQRLKRVRALRN